MTTAVEHRFVPRGTARELFNRRDKELIISGPAGTGKSRALLEKVHMMCLLTPGVRALVVRKTLISLTSTGLVTYREHVAKEAIENGTVSWYGGSLQEPAQYRFSNGSVMVVGGMDRPTKIMSGEYDVVFVQEATELTITDWENLTTRLRNGRLSFQQLLADCNPDRPTHWLKARADKGAAVMLFSSHVENPVLFTDDGELTQRGRDYMERLDALTGVRRSRLRDGIWAAAEGLIFESFDPAIHLVDDYEVPAAWPRYWVIDFGFVNPFVCQWWAQKPDGELVLYREWVRTKTLVEDHARTIKAFSDGEPRPQRIICDHDAEDRATLERHIGQGTTAAKKTVRDGVQWVESRLQSRRLSVMRGALCGRDADMDHRNLPQGLVEEIAGYIWLPPVNGRPAKEEPLKENDHSMDALRYMTADADGGTGVSVRWL